MAEESRSTSSQRDAPEGVSDKPRRWRGRHVTRSRAAGVFDSVTGFVVGMASNLLFAASIANRPPSDRFIPGEVSVPEGVPLRGLAEYVNTMNEIAGERPGLTAATLGVAGGLALVSLAVEALRRRGAPDHSLKAESYPRTYDKTTLRSRLAEVRRRWLTVGTGPQAADVFEPQAAPAAVLDSDNPNVVVVEPQGQGPGTPSRPPAQGPQEGERRGPWRR